MNYEIVKTKRMLTNALKECKVYHPISVSQHFVERVIEREINIFKLIHILNFAISHYSFLLMFDKTFSFKYSNEFTVVGEFRNDYYILKTVLSAYMKPNTVFQKTLKPM